MHQFKIICVFAVVTALALTSCHHTEKKQPAPPVTDTVAAVPMQGEKAEIRSWFRDPGLESWSRKMKKKDSGFSASRFSNTGIDSLEAQPSLPYPSAEWQSFRPYFVYSPDRHVAIDMYSYGNIVPDNPGDSGSSLQGGEPDSEVSLVDVKNRRKRRLLFAGPGTQFEKAAWLNDTIVLITGESDANPDNTMRPVMWKINLSDSSISTYEYQVADSSAQNY